ncbi:phytanoyl-CoA dioxygenase family protein, partial [Acinetobacter baumannii]
MAKFVLGNRFANLAKQLTGFAGIRLFHDHALLKMPGDSKPTPWHQDRPYWPMIDNGKPLQALSIWIALDDVDENNGCMM